MFPTPSTAKAGVACSQDAIQALGHGFTKAQSSSRWARSRKLSSHAFLSNRRAQYARPALPITAVSRLRANYVGKQQNGRRHATTHSENAMREAVCNLGEKITSQQVELEEAFAELELGDGVPKFSPEVGQNLGKAIQEYQDDLEERSLLISNPIILEEEEGVEELTAEEAEKLKDELTKSVADIDPALTLEERRELIASQLGEVVMESYFEEDDSGPSGPRVHPLTAQAQSRTTPSTVFLPRDSMVKPVASVLSDYSNKHISENALKNFGGEGLPLSTSCIRLSQQAPIPLTASQFGMSTMDGNSFLAVLYPGIYASVTHVLVEVRKRLGTDWLRDLLYKEGGARVLDAGGGGAGVLAWREIVKAEWSLMSPGASKDSTIPYGKSTVLTGSDVLRHRASELLENTTFIPRLPDYLHSQYEIMDGEAQKSQPRRKMFDVIIAPHTLLPLEEDYMRKDYVKNLWTMLNPNGGVLILLEKGRSQGFEAIGGARQMILDKLISSPGSTEYEELLETPSKQKYTQKEKGMIIAPCTNHSSCPLYMPGPGGKKRYYCHFSQRYIRPHYLQRIIGAKSKNHEDVLFSYLAVQRGVDQRELRGLTQGPAATDAAFAGYEHTYKRDQEEGPEGKETVVSDPEPTTTTEFPLKFDPLILPRIISPPLKRKGHVIMDMCTPAGKMERWTVPRSFSKQAFRDARKSQWGDLWALGAKTRINREATRAAEKAKFDEKKAKLRALQQEVDEEAVDELDADEQRAQPYATEDIDIPNFEQTLKRFESGGANRKRDGVTPPRWVRKLENKRMKQARKAELNRQRR